MSHRSIVPRELSGRYSVRRLTEDDTELLFGFCAEHELYYRFCQERITREAVQKDLRITPPGITAKDKFYVGFFDGGKLIAVMDLINGYPAEDAAFIGFFMVDVCREGNGVGSAVISEVLSYLKRQGFARCRLGIDRDNPQARHFWKKNGFLIEKEVKQERGVILVAEKRL